MRQTAGVSIKMQAQYTPLDKVRSHVSTMPNTKKAIIMLSTRECKECRTQHNEILKLKFHKQDLDHFTVDAHEWNRTFPQYQVHRVPVLYTASSVSGLTVLSDGVMSFQEMREKV